MATRIAITKAWLFATGVAVVTSYCVITHHKNTPADQKKAEKVAEQIAKKGTVSEYKQKTAHSSAVKKTTTAKVVDKEVKLPTYIPNPIYPSFTNALNNLVNEYIEAAVDGEVVVTNGFILSLKDGKPFITFPEEYKNINIGGESIGGLLNNGKFDVKRKRIENTDKWEMDGIRMSRFKRLDEPEFYCTDITYYALPSTKQIDSISMHGDLNLGNTAKAYEVVDEISEWMKNDYGAVDQKAVIPAGTLSLKKFTIGNDMEVVVSVKWDNGRKDKNTDAVIDISFTTNELVPENKYQRQELAKATDKARANTYATTGINYFTVNEKVNADSIKNKTVFR